VTAPGARPTPFALGLPDERWIDERFAAIAEEAAARGSDLADPGSFLLLAQVGASLDDLREGRGEGASSPESFHSFGLFLFHAFHLFGAGRREEAADAPVPRGLLLDVEPAMARYLVEASPQAPSGWTGALPGAAGYLRLPRNLFWTRPAGEDGTPEALDGVAWTQAHGSAARSELALLAVAGIVRERPGFSVLPVPPVPVAEASAWITGTGRPPGGGADFETTLPGGELGRLYSIETAGELLKLTARALALAESIPGTLVPAASRSELPAGLDARLRAARLVLAPGEAHDAP
jgi:hypothetical protein